MPTILVADDNSNIQKMVTLAFGEQGYDVVAVGNGEAAVRKLAEVRPDVVLADIFMPVRNGYELCEFIKKDASFFATPVVLLVGAFDPLDEKEARRVGADGILKKPFVPPDPLIAMVSALLKNAAKPAAAPAVERAAQIPAAVPPPAPLPSSASLNESDDREQFSTARGPFSLREEDGAENAGVHEFPRAADPSEEPADPENATAWRRELISRFEVPESDSGMVVEPNAASAPSPGTQWGNQKESGSADGSMQVHADENQTPQVHTPAPSVTSAEWMEFMSLGAGEAESAVQEELAPFRLPETPEAMAQPETASVAESPSDPSPSSVTAQSPESLSSPQDSWQSEQPVTPHLEAGIPAEEASVLSAARENSQTDAETPPSGPADVIPEPQREGLDFAAWNFGIAEPAHDDKFDLRATTTRIPEDSSRDSVPALQQTASGENDFAHLPSLHGEVQSFPAPALADPAAVEAIVQKVLERLEPVLHDMLAKEILKPLVENLLEHELQRK